MKWLIQVVIAVVLSQGWVWTNYLKDIGLITEEFRWWVLIALGVGLVVQQSILLRPHPADRRMVEDRRGIVEMYLKSLHHEYQDLLEKHVPPRIRLNVMLPRVKFWGRRLKIFYTHTPSGRHYSAEELALEWKPGCGAVGTALKTKDNVPFDSKDEKYNKATATLPRKHVETCADTNCVLAVPIIGNKGKVLGVLTLDSGQQMSETFFHDEVVLKLVQAYANNLEPILFPNGVS